VNCHALAEVETGLSRPALFACLSDSSQVGKPKKPIDWAACQTSTESKPRMVTPVDASIEQISCEQAVELSLLVHLEAQWENLLIAPPIKAGAPSTPKELNQKQRTYEAFFDQLVIYNKAYRPAHVAELLLNNASRLGKWCGSMRNLALQVQQDSPAHGPGHLLAKAYRWADHIADRMKANRIVRPTPAMSLCGAVQELEELAQWCQQLTRMANRPLER
jgi:hypothetical protein